MKYMIIYEKETGKITGYTSGDQVLENYYSHIPQMLDIYDSLYTDIEPHLYKHYKVVEGKIVKR